MPAKKTTAKNPKPKTGVGKTPVQRLAKPGPVFTRAQERHILKLISESKTPEEFFRKMLPGLLKGTAEQADIIFKGRELELMETFLDVLGRGIKLQEATDKEMGRTTPILKSVKEFKGIFGLGLAAKKLERMGLKEKPTAAPAK